MNATVQALILLAQLVPTIFALVKALEDIGGVEGTGQEKMAFVLNAIKTAIEQAGESGVTWAKLEPMVKLAVEAILKVLRKGK
jgi:hypothetical protein